MLSNSLPGRLFHDPRGRARVPGRHDQGQQLVPLPATHRPGDPVGIPGPHPERNARSVLARKHR